MFTNRVLPDENAPNGDESVLALCDAMPDPEDGPDPQGFDFIDRVTDFQRFLAPPPQTPRQRSPACRSCGLGASRGGCPHW